MEIKGINGAMSVYGAQKKSGVLKKSSASVSAKGNNTDRIEFGFDTALNAARNGIAQEIKADATPSELLDAKETAENGIDAAQLAAYILMG